MPKRKKKPYGFGRLGPSEVLRRLDILGREAGTQKALADRLGVSTSTLRRWQTFKQTPDQKYIQKINRLYNRREAARKPKIGPVNNKLVSVKKKLSVKIKNLRDWVSTFFTNEIPSMLDYIRNQFLKDMADRGIQFAAYYNENPREAQFLTADQAVRLIDFGETDILGKKPGLKSARLVGSVIMYPYQRMDLGYRSALIPLQPIGNQSYSYMEMMNYCREKYFMADYTAEQLRLGDDTPKYKDKTIPHRFFGYYVGG